MTSFSIAHIGKKIWPLFSVLGGIKSRYVIFLLATKRFSAMLLLYLLDSNFRLYFSTFSHTVLSYDCPYMHVSISELCLRTCGYPVMSDVSPYVQVSLSEPRDAVRAVIPF